MENPANRWLMRFHRNYIGAVNDACFVKSFGLTGFDFFAAALSLGHEIKLRDAATGKVRRTLSAEKPNASIA